MFRRVWRMLPSSSCPRAEALDGALCAYHGSGDESANEYHPQHVHGHSPLIMAMMILAVRYEDSSRTIQISACFILCFLSFCFWVLE
jgi:hypothetical protein